MKYVVVLFSLLLGGKTVFPAALIFLAADWLSRFCPATLPEEDDADALFFRYADTIENS